MILSGRNGTPLWTMSRELYPKQLLSLLGELSLPQETAWRVHGHGLAPAVVVCGEPHRFINAEQLRNLSIRPAKIVLEPVVRGTAPAIAAAVTVARRDPDALMLVCPADHTIVDRDAFPAAVATAAGSPPRGIWSPSGCRRPPPRPATPTFRLARQWGCTTTLDASAPSSRSRARRSRSGWSNGSWTWNSGVFLPRPRLFLDELTRFGPELARGCERGAVGPGLRAAGVLAVRALPVRLDRQRRHGAHRARGGRPPWAWWDDVGSWSSL